MNTIKKAKRASRAKNGKQSGVQTKPRRARSLSKSGRMAKLSPGGAPEDVIRFAVGECSLGFILVAASSAGVCAISLGDGKDRFVRKSLGAFPHTEWAGGDKRIEDILTKVTAFVENPRVGLKLPLDVRGTAFQRRVWKALCAIPTGSTATYSTIARRIGSPRAVRAVAGACASNHISLAIPCHRVVRSDGSLSGYRWGAERKRALLEHERGLRLTPSGN